MLFPGLNFFEQLGKDAFRAEKFRRHSFPSAHIANQE